VARLVVTISTASRDYYVRVGIPSEKILVLPNGISSRLWEEGVELARRIRLSEVPAFAPSVSWAA